MTNLREAAQQALEALEEATSYTSCTTWSPSMTEECAAAASALRAALAEPEGWGNLPPPLQGPAVAENATTQRQFEETPPSEYRRGYWDGFAIGKREGRIEAEDALADEFCDTHCTWADHAAGCVRAEPLSVTVTELQEALVYTNLIDRDAIDDPDGYDEGSTLEQIDALHRKLTAAQGCNPHPKAPHGFLRNASHTEDRYVCECEYWEPYEAGYQAGMEAALRAQS